MENPTNADLARQIDKLAEAVAAGFADVHQKMDTLATKEEMHKRFDALDQRLDRIEKGYEYRITNLERDVADLKT